MDWKREAIEKLKSYTARKNAVVSIPEEIKSLEMAAHRIRSANPDGTPVAGGGSSREDMLLSNIVKREELEMRLTEAKVWIATVDRALAVLMADERLVLERLCIYPCKGAVDRLCEELNVEKSTIYRRKEAALEHFTFALYGAIKT